MKTAKVRRLEEKAGQYIGVISPSAIDLILAEKATRLNVWRSINHEIWGKG